MRSLLGAVVDLASGAASRAGTTPPVPYSQPYAGGMLGLMQRHGDGTPATSQLSAPRASSTLFAVTRRFYEAVGALDWHLYRTARSGQDEDRTEVTSHAALDLINKPNKHMTRTQLFEQSELWLDLTGEAYWVIERLAGIPIAVWPVRPDRMQPIPSPDHFLAGWVYTGPGGEVIPLDVSDVIQFKLPHPDDPYRGLGPVQALLYSVDNVRYGLEWNRNFFRNSAIPYGVITLPQSMDDTQWRRFTMRWREGHQGVGNSHRVGVLENGATWTDGQLGQRDMQFAELIDQSRDMIQEAFTLPRSMSGQSADVNKANAQQGAIDFGALVDQRGARFRDALNHVLLPQFNAVDLEFDFDSAVPNDDEAQDASLLSRAQAAQILVNTGFEPASVLETCQLPDMAYHKPEPPAPAVMPPPNKPDTAPEPNAPAPNEQPANVLRVPAWIGWGALDAVEEPAIEAAAQQPHEQVDLTQVQEEYEAALVALMAIWPGVLGAWAVALAAQAGTAVASGRLAQLASLALAQGDLDGPIREVLAALEDMASTAGHRAVQEAARQGRHITVGTVASGALDGLAGTAVRMIANWLAGVAGQHALAIAGPESTSGAVEDAVRIHLAGLSDAVARGQFGRALTSAQNHGRFSTFAGVPAPEPALYADERMDSRTCEPCREVNGKWLGNASDMAQVWKTYPNGGYVACRGLLGGNTCRGTVTAVYRPEQVDGEL